MPTANKSILALDVGGSRVGVALANRIARLANPLCTLRVDDSFWAKLKNLVEHEDGGIFVVGLPRNLDGQPTAQTADIERFTDELKRHFDLPVYMQDEAVTSRKAEAELKARGKPYQRGDIDALAATYILEDWLSSSQELIDD